MLDFTQYALSSQVLTIVMLFFGLIALVAAVNSLWRSHKMLATFIRLCIVFILISIVKKTAQTLGYSQIANWYFIEQWIDTVRSFFVMLAMIELYKIVRVINGETFRVTGLRSTDEGKRRIK